MKLGERGGRRRDFHDVGINTRQAMEHVKESKTGLLPFKIYIPAYSVYVYYIIGGEDC